MTAAQEVALLIRKHSDALLAHWREKAKEVHQSKHLDRPTLNDHIPMLLDELAAALAEDDCDSVSRQITKGSSPIHGLQRLANGFEIEEVVAEYNILRNCIHDLAEKHGVILHGRLVKVLNSALDAAIGAAINAYVVQKDLDTQRKREDYLAFVAHDLRTPLSAIALSAKILEKELAQCGRSARAALASNTLERNVGYLTNLISKVLEENANLETESGIRLELRHVDLWPLVESLVHDLYPVAGSGSTAIINAIPEDLIVYADAALLRRAFQNLIANAIRHTPDGEIRILARRLPGRGMVECEVTDNGSGIAEELLPHVFNKYETDGKRSTDMGLGLAICKTFIEAHGGEIAVKSEPGNGASFYFTLPDSVSSERALTEQVLA
jgi:two-component system, OmpR family, phosphate regulon sensor histidine kinase PhoR